MPAATQFQETAMKKILIALALAAAAAAATGSNQANRNLTENP